MINTMPRMRTLKEAANETGLSYHCIRQWCLENKIIYIRAGNKFLINLDRLVEYLNTGVNEVNQTVQKV